MNKDRLTREQVVKNLKAMRIPSELLKFGASGKPKFRTFLLTNDMGVRYLTWESQNKGKEQTRIALSDAREVRYGQRTEKFVRNNRKDLEHLSFSIMYAASPQSPGSNLQLNTLASSEMLSLDLVCKDEREFQIWAPTFLALCEPKNSYMYDEDLWAQVFAVEHKNTQSLQAGPASTVAVKEEEETYDIYTFGWGELGQTGTESSSNFTPKLVESLLGKGVIEVACGWSHTAILIDGGAVLQCGSRLSTGLPQDVTVPSPLTMKEKIGTVVTLSCGSFHTLALTDSGEVLSWGSNFFGQLGLGHTRDVQTPSSIPVFKNATRISKIAAGHYFSVALDDENNLYTWGCGERGVLGHNDTADVPEPKVVQGLVGTSIIKIAAGGAHMFACTERDTYAWGWNACGQLGFGHDKDQWLPHVVDAFRGCPVKAIACGAAHSVAVALQKQVGQYFLYTWGSNSNGQLGQDKKTSVSKPTLISFADPESMDIIDVACGDTHTCFRTANGNVFVAGSNTQGQLGLGHNSDSFEFKLIPQFRDKESRGLSCGGAHTAVLTARAWIADHEAKECMSCKSGFTFVNRKHHCRNCGGIFCGTCSTKKIAILRLGLTQPVRTCDECYRKLGGR